MIDLIIMACLISAPDQCQPHRIPWDGSLFTCGLYGQAEAAKWQNEHPKWRFKRYRCAPVDGQDA